MVLEAGQRVLAVPCENEYHNETAATASATSSWAAGQRCVVFDEGDNKYVAYKSGKIVATDKVIAVPIEGRTELSVCLIDYPDWIVNGCFAQGSKGWTMDGVTCNFSGPSYAGCPASWKAYHNGGTTYNNLVQTFHVGCYVNRVSCYFWTWRENGVRYHDELWGGNEAWSTVNCGVACDGSGVTCPGGWSNPVWAVDWQRDTYHTVSAWGCIEWEGAQSWDDLIYVTAWKTWRA